MLRELRMEDWVDAQVLDSDPEVVRFQSNDVVDEEGTKKYLAGSIAAQSERPRRPFDLAICLPRDDRFLGHVGFRIERPRAQGSAALVQPPA